VTLDLGATAKGLGADWAAAVAQAGAHCGGVLVGLGGDVAMAGVSPAGGWPVLIADDHRQRDRADSGPARSQQVRISQGAVATSSVGCRRWRRSGRALHHILDPRTGLPSAGPWRTASVAAATCAEANAASTAAIILGDDAPDWLAAEGLPARLVRHDGATASVGSWPVADDAELHPPPARMPLLAGDDVGAPAAGPAGRRGRS
jgi:thiamine biosynthesis lipoprotein